MSTCAACTSKRIQVDEIWSFTYAKAKNVPTAKAAPVGAGDTWTWTAIDADTKLVMSWLFSGRDGQFALAFMDDLRSRLANRVQLMSDNGQALAVKVQNHHEFSQLNHRRRPVRISSAGMVGEDGQARRFRPESQ